MRSMHKNFPQILVVCLAVIDLGNGWSKAGSGKKRLYPFTRLWSVWQRS